MTSTKDLEFITAMREVVADAGEDFVYDDEYRDEDGECLYVNHEGTGPSCLIGRALFLTGVSLETLSENEGQNAIAILPGLGYSTELVEAAQNAQESQDERNTWGTALGIFERSLRRSGVL